MSTFSPHLIDNASHFWSKRAGKVISTEDARQIIENMAGFFRVLSEWDARERSDLETAKQQDTAKPMTAGRTPD